MNQIEINRNAFLRHERNLVIYLMDDRSLNNNQCYMVVSFHGNRFFVNKIQLEKYLLSLAPTFEYKLLSELALYLIENEIVVDVSMTKRN